MNRPDILAPALNPARSVPLAFLQSFFSTLKKKQGCPCGSARLLRARDRQESAVPAVCGDGILADRAGGVIGRTSMKATSPKASRRRRANTAQGAGTRPRPEGIQQVQPRTRDGATRRVTGPDRWRSGSMSMRPTQYSVTPCFQEAGHGSSTGPLIRAFRCRGCRRKTRPRPNPNLSQICTELA